MKKYLNFIGIEPIIRVSVYRILLVYIIFTLCRIEFYLFNRAFFQGVTASNFIHILMGGLKFDTVAIFYTNILFILLSFIPLKIRYHSIYQSVIFYIFILTNGLAILANFVDYIYYPFTLRRTTFSVFQEFINETNKGGLAFRFLIDYWQALVLYVATIWGFVWAYKKVKVAPLAPVKWWRYYSLGIIFFAASIVLFIGGVRGGYKHSTRPITLSNAGDYASHPNEMHMVLNTPFSIYKTIEIRSLTKKDYFSEAALENIYSPIKEFHPKAAFKPMNVVVIIIESFGKENIGFYNKNLENGTYKGFTPFLDSLCQHSLVYWDSYANGRKSIDALPSVISSIPSIVEPFILTEYYDNDLPSLPVLLKKEGFHTSFFHGAPNGSMGLSAYCKMAGIDHYYGLNEYANNNDFDGTWGIWDEPFLQFMSAKLSTFPQPFVSYVFTVSSHHPFKLPEKYKNSFPEGPQAFHHTIGYTDMALRKFFKSASKEKWFKNTLFVITADHCNSTPVHDVYLTPSGFFKIPIIFYHGSDTLSEIKHELVQQIDIMPTILGMMHYNKQYFSFGFDVVHEANRFVVNYANETCQIFYHDYMLQFRDNKTKALYNFKTDLLLTQNLKDIKKDTAQIMENYAKAFMQQYSNRMIDNKLHP